MDITTERALLALKNAMESYAPLSADSWQAMQQLLTLKQMDRAQLLYRAGEVPRSFAFVYSGLLRVFTTNAEGQEYNKNFFAEGSFPGTMPALLLEQPSYSSIETLEPTVLLLIHFKGYRTLLFQRPDLMAFHIHYLEKNWLLAKDAREIAMVQQDASQRYRSFLQSQPALAQRLPLYHIASHLGITPTQLSRIRKMLVSQPM